jgi:hypothetical protein
MNEETLSSKSVQHFGHYKVGSKSDIILHYHAVRVMVTLTHGIQLERWLQSLSVMLEQTLCVTLVIKLRAILLMEANFNATNKINYGVRMMDNVQGYNLMPEEIFSKKSRMANNVTLCKKIFYDITRQARVRRQLGQLMPPNAMTGLCTLWHHWYSKHLACPPRLHHVRGYREHEVLPLYRIRRLKVIRRQQNQHENTRTYSRKWSIAGWLGSY